MHLHLVDTNSELVLAWTNAFRRFPEVEIRHENLLAIAEHCVVSPANSYGFMDGGIDAAYCAFFGRSIEGKVKEAIALRSEKMLPVGSSLSVATGNARIPYLIVAPTMTMPEAVESQNCYRAMRAILRIADQQQEIAKKIFCPGLGTGVGMVPPENAAAMMAQAYQDWKTTARSLVANANDKSSEPS